MKYYENVETNILIECKVHGLRKAVQPNGIKYACPVCHESGRCDDSNENHCQCGKPNKYSGL